MTRNKIYEETNTRLQQAPANMGASFVELDHRHMLETPALKLMYAKLNAISYRAACLENLLPHFFVCISVFLMILSIPVIVKAV